MKKKLKKLDTQEARRVGRFILVFACAMGSLAMVGFVMFP